MDKGKKFFVYVTSYVGNFGTKILIEKKRNESKNFFSEEYLDKVLNDIELSMHKDDIMSSLSILEENLNNCENIEKGGFLAALWKICDKNNVGLEFELGLVPILQGTVEIANFFNINPYKLLTKNAKIIFLEEKDLIYLKNKKNFFSGKMIGETNNQKKRVRIDCESEAFLTKDYKDEIDKVLLNYSKKIKENI